MGGPGSGAYKRTRPAGSGTWFRKHFYYDLVLAPEEERVMPETVAHDEIGRHPFGCECPHCQRYPAELKRRLKRRQRGFSKATSDR